MDFVNWEEKESDEKHHCVEMTAPSGYWDNTDCSSEKGFICKKPKGKTQKQSTSLYYQLSYPYITSLEVISDGLI